MLKPYCTPEYMACVVSTWSRPGGPTMAAACEKLFFIREVALDGVQENAVDALFHGGQDVQHRLELADGDELEHVVLQAGEHQQAAGRVAQAIGDKDAAEARRVGVLYVLQVQNQVVGAFGVELHKLRFEVGSYGCIKLFFINRDDGVALFFIDGVFHKETAWGKNGNAEGEGNKKLENA
nr:hypothetical protein [Tanacetum cinerariifolium]